MWHELPMEVGETNIAVDIGCLSCCGAELGTGLGDAVVFWVHIGLCVC